MADNRDTQTQTQKRELMASSATGFVFFVTYLRSGCPGDYDVVAIEEQWRHGRLIASWPLGGGQHLKHAGISHAFVDVHVMDERLAAGREHRFVLTNYTKRKEKKKTTAVTTIINHRDNFPKYYTMRIPFSFSKKNKTQNDWVRDSLPGSCDVYDREAVIWRCDTSATCPRSPELKPKKRDKTTMRIQHKNN